MQTSSKLAPMSNKRSITSPLSHVEALAAVKGYNAKGKRVKMAERRTQRNIKRSLYLSESGEM